MEKEIVHEDVAFDTKIKKLRRFNLIMGFLHLVQSVFMFIITLVVDTPGETYPVYSNYLTFNRELGGLVADTQQIWDAPLGIGIALFLLISAVAHFSLATFGYKWYVENLKQNMNKARRFEYAVSSSFMLVVIAWLCGMFDFVSIMPLFSLNACMNLFGYMVEAHNQNTKKTDRTSFIFGCFAGLVPWIALFMYFTEVRGGSPPGFVYGIMISIAFFFNIFAMNMVLQYQRVGRWKDYLYGERF